MSQDCGRRGRTCTSNKQTTLTLICGSSLLSANADLTFTIVFSKYKGEKNEEKKVLRHGTLTRRKEGQLSIIDLIRLVPQL
jgi:hypothetical protein